MVFSAKNSPKVLGPTCSFRCPKLGGKPSLDLGASLHFDMSAPENSFFITNHSSRLFTPPQTEFDSNQNGTQLFPMSNILGSAPNKASPLDQVGAALFFIKFVGWQVTSDVKNRSSVLAPPPKFQVIDTAIERFLAGVNQGVSRYAGKPRIERGNISQ